MDEYAGQPYIRIPCRWLDEIIKLTDEQAGTVFGAILHHFFKGEEDEIEEPELKDLYQRMVKSIRYCENKSYRQKGRHTAAYKEFRKIVLERDNYTCQICGKVGGELDVHHIKSFESNPELRTDPDNGVTLCKECHREVHRKYGRKDFVLSQLL